MKKLILVIIAISFLSCKKDNVVPTKKPLRIESNPVFNTGKGFDNAVYASVIQSDGKVVIGGSFTSYNDTLANRIIRLNPNGNIDASFMYGSGFAAPVICIAVQADNKIIVAGQFTSYNGIQANRIVRLNSNGSIDASFVCGNAFNGNVTGIAVQSDNKIILTGQFTSYNSVSANYIVRLNSDGSIDNTFNTSFNDHTYIARIQSDGKILVGGIFTLCNGSVSNRIARLNYDGTKDNSFVIGSGFDFNVNEICIQPDNKILVGGSFSSYNSILANKIIKLNTDGSIDISFNYGSGFNSTIKTINTLSTGEIFIGGFFTSYNGIPSNGLVKISSSGGPNIISANFNGSILTFGIRPDDSIMYAAGTFTTYNSTSANFITAVD